LRIYASGCIYAALVSGFSVKILILFMNILWNTNSITLHGAVSMFPKFLLILHHQIGCFCPSRPEKHNVVPKRAAGNILICNQGSVAGTFECVNKTLGSTNCGEFLD